MFCLNASREHQTLSRTVTETWSRSQPGGVGAAAAGSLGAGTCYGQLRNCPYPHRRPCASLPKGRSCGHSGRVSAVRKGVLRWPSILWSTQATVLTLPQEQALHFSGGTTGFFHDNLHPLVADLTYTEISPIPNSLQRAGLSS